MGAIVILAGGESRRMGEDKSFLSYQGTSFLEYLINRASAVFDRVLISAGSEEHGALIAQRLSVSALPSDSGHQSTFTQPITSSCHFIPRHFEIIIDAVPDCGPMGGLMSVFKNTDLKCFAVTAADMPGADMQVLAALLERLEKKSENLQDPENTGQSISAVMLKLHPDYPEPCAAAYDRSSYPIMAAACEKGIRSIVRALGSNQIEPVTVQELKKSSPAFAELDFEKAFRNINTPEEYLHLTSLKPD